MMQQVWDIVQWSAERMKNTSIVVPHVRSIVRQLENHATKMHVDPDASVDRDMWGNLLVESAFLRRSVQVSDCLWWILNHLVMKFFFSKDHRVRNMRNFSSAEKLLYVRWPVRTTAELATSLHTGNARKDATAKADMLVILVPISASM